MAISSRFRLFDIIPIVNMLILVAISAYLLSAKSGSEIVQHIDKSNDVTMEMVKTNRESIDNSAKDMTKIMSEFNSLQEHLITLYESLMKAIDSKHSILGSDGGVK